MITIREKEHLIREHMQVQKILNGLPVRKECESCSFWIDMCMKFNASPPEHVQNEGCDNWIERDIIPF